MCLSDPVGDVYACPFAIRDEFLAGNVRCQFYGDCRGGCMAAKFFTGPPMDGPDPECVLGHAEAGLVARDGVEMPKVRVDHSKRKPEPRPCDDSPLADLDLMALAAGKR